MRFIVKVHIKTAKCATQCCENLTNVCKRTEISLSLDLRCVLLARIRVFLLLAFMRAACIANAVPIFRELRYICVCICVCVSVYILRVMWPIRNTYVRRRVRVHVNIATGSRRRVYIPCI